MRRARIGQRIRAGVAGMAVIALCSTALAGIAPSAYADDEPPFEPRDHRTETSIVGGQFVTEQQPWIAALHHGSSFTCTASQIGPEWILTAAHCVEQDSGYSVRIGSLTRSSGGAVVAVSEVHRYPSYDWPRSDIALLRLAQPHANTYPSLASASDIAQGQNATIYGWGSENADWSGPLPENLKYAVGQIDDPACVDGDAPLLCTQTDGSVAGGDSGGPVFVQNGNGDWLLGGTCAVGHRPAGSGWAGYTSVVEHRSWITDLTGI